MSDVVALRYRAFISYSHEDAVWARWLHRWLEDFRGEEGLLGRDRTGAIHRTLRPICRDPGDLVDAPSQQTLAALDAAQSLIVICSPAAARNSYLAEQVRLFKSHHPERPIIPLIVGGRPEDPELECFPSTLKFKLDAAGKITNEAIEVFAADAREEGDGETLALAKTVAGILGVSADEVVQRSERGFGSLKSERRRQARIVGIKDGIQLAIKGGAAVTVLALIALVSVLAYLDYQRRQHLATIDTLVANYGVIDRTQTSAPDTGPRAAEAIDSLQQRATDEPRYVKALELLGAGKYQEAEALLQAVAEDKKRLAASSKETAAAFRNLAAIAAISDHGKARANYAEAAALDPDHIEGMFWNGWFQAEAGALTKAETAYQRVINLTKSREEDWARYWSLLGVGDIRLSRSDLSAATAAYQAASEMADRLLEAAPNDDGWQRDLPVAYIKVGDVMLAQGYLAEALTPYRKGLALIERLAKSDPSNAYWQRDLVAGYGRVGLVLARQGKATLALDPFSRGRAIAARLKGQFADSAQLSQLLAAFDTEIANSRRKSQ